MTRKLRRTVESAYRKFSGSWRPHPDELREPIEAARALAERWSERLSSRPASRPPTEVLAETPVSLGATDPLRAEAREGTGMQSLALLMLLGAVLEAENGSPVESGAEPLVLIEEAEAHLHPILAARVFRLIDRVAGPEGPHDELGRPPRLGTAPRDPPARQERAEASPSTASATTPSPSTRCGASATTSGSTGPPPSSPAAGSSSRGRRSPGSFPRSPGSSG